MFVHMIGTTEIVAKNYPIQFNYFARTYNEKLREAGK